MDVNLVIISVLACSGALVATYCVAVIFIQPPDYVYHPGYKCDTCVRYNHTEWGWTDPLAS